MCIECIKKMDDGELYDALLDIRSRERPWPSPKYIVLESVFYRWSEIAWGEWDDDPPDYYTELEAEVLDKMIVSYITGKTRKLQRWWRSLEELPMACPCPE